MKYITKISDRIPLPMIITHLLLIGMIMIVMIASFPSYEGLTA